MLQEAIILAGGFGSRLQSVVSDRPKPMALVAGKSFLEYIFQYLKFYRIQKVVLSVGFKYEMIQDHFKDNFCGINIEYAVEKEALGTGGGIRLAMEKCSKNSILVLNGDSFLDLNLNAFYANFNSLHADVLLALREIDDTARYGTIKLTDGYRIKHFLEKNGEHKSGIINGGTYLIKRSLFLEKTPSNKNFSIEKDVFEKHLLNHVFGYPTNGFFIDIGIPEDYAKAQQDFKDFKYF